MSTDNAGRTTYRELDAFRLSDGRVLVCPDTEGHRVPEEYVPRAELKRLRSALEAIAAWDCDKFPEDAWRMVADAREALRVPVAGDTKDQDPRP